MYYGGAGTPSVQGRDSLWLEVATFIQGKAVGRHHHRGPLHEGRGRASDTDSLTPLPLTSPCVAAALVRKEGAYLEYRTPSGGARTCGRKRCAVNGEVVWGRVPYTIVMVCTGLCRAQRYGIWRTDYF